MQICVRNIDADLHRRFKVHCAGRGVSLNAEIIALMEKRIGHSPKRRRKKTTLTQPSNS